MTMKRYVAPLSVALGLALIPVAVSAQSNDPRPPDAYVAQRGERLLDTRTTGKLRAGVSYDVQIPGADVGGVTAVTLNLKALNAKAAGYLTVYPQGPQPHVSQLDFEPGGIFNNQATIGLTQGGSVRVFTSADVDVVIDWFGSFEVAQVESAE